MRISHLLAVYTILFLTFGCIHVGFAQLGTIQGMVYDKNKQPLEFVTLSLLNPSDSSYIKSKMSDSSGKYTLAQIPFGNYIVQAELLGYISQRNLVRVNSSTIQWDITIEDAGIEVSEVVIEGFKTQVRQENDKMIVSVENTLSAAGLTLLDLLSRSPGVNVDQSGTISIRGRSGVQIQIDGKTMYLSGETLKNYLRNIQAEQIKELEIITAPSARNDAAGSGGIINVVLKRNKKRGMNAHFNINGGSGLFHKFSVGANVGYKDEKWDLSLGYQYANRKNYNHFYADRLDKQLILETPRTFTFSNYTIPLSSNSVNYSLSRILSKASTLQLNGNIEYEDNSWSSESGAYSLKPNGAVVNYYNGGNAGRFIGTSFNSSLKYELMPDTSGITKFTTQAGLTYVYGKNDKNDYRFTQFDSLDQETGNYMHNVITGYEESLLGNLGLDFSRKLGKYFQIETGAEINLSKSTRDNNFILENQLSLDTVPFYFSFTENIYAAYLMGTMTKGKWSVQAGVRSEYTNNRGGSKDQSISISRDYVNFFPSGNITYNPTKITSLSVLYSKRITRPNADQYNPIEYYTTPFSSWKGNPYVVPEFTDLFELVINLFESKSVLTIGYSYIKNPLLYMTLVDSSNGKTITSNRNTDFQRSLTCSETIAFPLTKWWDTNNTIVVGYHLFQGTNDFGTVQQEQFGWNLKSTQSFKVLKNYAVELSGSYESPTVYSFAQTFALGQLNLAVQRSLFKKKGSIKLAVNDIFWTFQYGGYTNATVADIRSNYKWDNRTVMLTFTYKLDQEK